VRNVAPSVTASFASTRVACGSNNATLNVSFTDPSTVDTHVATIDWGDGSSQTVSPATSPLSVQHTYAHAGSYTATVAVTDDDGDTTSTTAAIAVNYTTSGVLPPINSDGSSVFKYKSTILVKVTFTDCDGTRPTDLAPRISLTLISGSTPNIDINEPISTSAADTSGVMRFSDGQYIYNLATKPLPDPSATYRVTITLANGQTVTATFGLRP
jgi:PKD repeat protein